nr:exodeoxyribonuclease V subunit gamma [Clostridium senegalense]
MFKGLNTYSEIQYVAKEILRLCRDENYRFKDIAVITRNLDSYEDIIKAIFSEYKIPYFLDMKKDVESNPIVIMVKSALEIILKNFSYESVFRYLKSEFIDIDMEDVDILENYVIAYGITGEKNI